MTTIETTTIPSSPALDTRPVLTLRPGSVTLAELRRIHRGEVRLAMDDSAWPAVRAAQATVQDIIAADAVVYGINTGFGKLAQSRIAHDKLAQLQRNLVLSHSVGTGSNLAADTVRLVLAIKAVSLARGHSGVRPALIEALLALANHGVTPCIPSKGSVGASGDLAPLAHMSCTLIGVGEVLVDGERVSAAQGLERAGLAQFELGPKEGLALLNGTQVSTALALAGLFAAEDMFAGGVVAGALSLEAIKGSVKPFDARIHAARGQAGQIDVAGAVRTLLDGSGIVDSHRDCGRVQDPYSIRCQPQVMGACLDNLRHAARVLEIEANAASDNPLVFPEHGRRDVGWQFPRRAGSVRGRHHRAGHCRDRRHRRTPHRAVARYRPVRPAAVPRARGRTELRLHDRAGHRGGARFGEQMLALSVQRGQPAHLGQSGRPRIDGDLRVRGGSATWSPTPRSSSASRPWPRRRASSFQTPTAIVAVAGNRTGAHPCTRGRTGGRPLPRARYRGDEAVGGGPDASTSWPHAVRALLPSLAING
jgi:hypothetical protein